MDNMTIDGQRDVLDIVATLLEKRPHMPVEVAEDYARRIVAAQNRDDHVTWVRLFHEAFCGKDTDVEAEQ